MEGEKDESSSPSESPISMEVHQEPSTLKRRKKSPKVKVWFQLYDKDTGQPYKESDATFVKIKENAKVARFLLKVILFFKAQNSTKLQGYDSTDLRVYRNKDSFDKRKPDKGTEEPLESDVEIAHLGISADVVAVPHRVQSVYGIETGVAPMETDDLPLDLKSTDFTALRNWINIEGVDAKLYRILSKHKHTNVSEGSHEIDNKFVKCTFPTLNGKICPMLPVASNPFYENIKAQGIMLMNLLNTGNSVIDVGVSGAGKTSSALYVASQRFSIYVEYHSGETDKFVFGDAGLCFHVS